MILEDQQEMESMILQAFKETGLRVLLSKGWAKLGQGLYLPSNVFSLGDVPHSWLFPRCMAVIHHGGAGSTAAGVIPLLNPVCDSQGPQANLGAQHWYVH